jgi:hypothetical protein
MTSPEIQSRQARWAAAHAAGMAALRCGDYEGFGEAILRERAIIIEQRDAIRRRLDRSSRSAVRPARGVAPSR